MRNPKMVVTVVAVMAGVGDDKHNIESALPQHYTNRNFILCYFILVYFFLPFCGFFFQMIPVIHIQQPSIVAERVFYREGGPHC